MPAIETYLVTHTFTTRVGATSPQDALTRAHGEIVRNEQAALLTERSTTLYDAPKVTHAGADDETAGARAIRVREHWTTGPGSDGKAFAADMRAAQQRAAEDNAPRCYMRGRNVLVQVDGLTEKGVLMLPGDAPEPEMLTADVRGTLRAGGTVMDVDGLRIDTEGDEPEPGFEEISGRLVRTLRRLFDEYGRAGTLLIGCRLAPDAFEHVARHSAPDYTGLPREDAPPTADDIIDRLVDREALAEVARHLTKIGTAMANALAQVQVPQVVLTLSPESQASIDALRDIVASSMRKGADPTSPRQG